MNYSGFLKRIAAFVIDLIVMFAMYMAIGLIFHLSRLSAPILALPMIGLWFYGGMLALSWVYFAGFESSRYQATIGKRLLGLKVTSVDGERISFLRASIRYYSKSLSRIPLMIGFFMILFTKKNQGLHDKIARTVIQTIR